MQGSKEMFHDMREAEIANDDLAMRHNNYPVFDMNTMSSKEDIIYIGDGEKKEIINITSADYASRIIEAIKEGHIDPLEFMVKKKLITDALEMAAKNEEVKQLTMTEIEKEGKGCSKLGAKISITSRPRYDYKQDAKWQEIENEIFPLRERQKDQEKKIQAATKNNCSLVDHESGEIIASVVPAPASDSITVSFSKRKRGWCALKEQLKDINV